MTEAVANSLANLKFAFRYRRKPLSVPHCKMCYSDNEVASFLALDRDSLMEPDLHPILWDGYVCWGTWSQVAYYIPRMLELFADDHIVETDRMFMLMLYPIRPETGFWIGDPVQDCDIDADEVEAVAEFVGEAVLAHIAEERRQDSVWWMTEPMSFLGALSIPIGPLLDRMATNDDVRVRANFGLFLAECVIGYQQPLGAWKVKPEPTPDNRAAMDHWLTPSILAAYLLDHSADFEVFGKDAASTALLAFDWAAAQMQGTSGA